VITEFRRTDTEPDRAFRKDGRRETPSPATDWIGESSDSGTTSSDFLCVHGIVTGDLGLAAIQSVPPPRPKIVEELIGYVERLEGKEAHLRLFREGTTQEPGILRVFDADFVRSHGLKEEGQLLSLTVELRSGDPCLVLQPIIEDQAKQPFEIVKGLDYSRFRKKHE